MGQLNADAIKDAVAEAGGDSKKVPDQYYRDGTGGASAADKVDALITLSSAYAEYKAGSAQMEGKVDIKGEWDGGTYTSNAPFFADVEYRLEKLSNDPEVQQFMADAVTKKVPEKINGDPALKAEMERRLDVATSEGALEREMAKTGADGKPVSINEAVAAYVGNASTLGQALGKEPDLQTTFKNLPQETKDKITSAYEDVVSGKNLQDEMKNGVSLNDALVHSAVDKAALGALLDDETVAKGDEKFNEQITRLAADQLTDGLSVDDIIGGLGTDGSDEALQKLIDDNTGRLTEPGQPPARATDVVAAVRRVEDLMRHGATFDSAMKELDKDWKNLMPAGIGDSAKTGILHAASSVLLAGAIGARHADGGKTDTVQTVGQSLTAASLLSGGFYKMNQHGSATTWENGKIFGSDNIDQAFKDVKNGVSTLGIAGDVIGLVYGSMSAKASADKGDTLNAGFQGTFAALDGISSVAGAAELGAYIAARVAPSIATQAGVVGAVASSVGAVVGGVAAVVGLLYTAITAMVNGIKAQNAADDFHKDMAEKFKEVNMDIPGHNAMIQNFDLEDEKKIWKDPSYYDKWYADQSGDLNGPG